MRKQLTDRLLCSKVGPLGPHRGDTVPGRKKGLKSRAASKAVGFTAPLSFGGAQSRMRESEPPAYEKSRKWEARGSGLHTTVTELLVLLLYPYYVRCITHSELLQSRYGCTLHSTLSVTDKKPGPHSGANPCHQQPGGPDWPHKSAAGRG